MTIAYPTFTAAADAPIYRAYVVVGGRFRGAEVLDCLDDACAEAMAGPLLSRGDAVEVWERARFVTRVDNRPTKAG